MGLAVVRPDRESLLVAGGRPAHDKFIWSTAYHVFNGGVFWATMGLFAIAPDQARRYGRWALLIALAIEAAAVLLDTGIRNSGTFENPNKLGYCGRCWSAPCGSP